MSSSTNALVVRGAEGLNILPHNERIAARHQLVDTGVKDFIVPIANECEIRAAVA